MSYLLNKDCKIRAEIFGGIIRLPINIVLKTGQTFYEVNEVGFDILNQCIHKSSLQDIVEVVHNLYDIDLSEAEKDIVTFLGNFIELGIIKEV